MALNIKAAIKRAGKTNNEVAETMGISNVGLSQHINGNPSITTLKRIAEAIGCDIVDLFDNKSNKITCPHCGQEIYFK